eukprot:Gb_35955 [translate_table: standard]
MKQKHWAVQGWKPQNKQALVPKRLWQDYVKDVQPKHIPRGTGPSFSNCTWSKNTEQTWDLTPKSNPVSINLSTFSRQIFIPQGQKDTVKSVHDLSERAKYCSRQATLSIAIFRPPKAIRGGIPICFPQFGNRGSLEQHGFARNKFWAIDSHPPPFPVKSCNNKAIADLILKSTEDDLKSWPHCFEFRLRVALAPGGDLTLISRIRNIDSRPFTFSFAYRTYFCVSDISDLAVLWKRSFWLLSDGPQGEVSAWPQLCRGLLSVSSTYKAGLLAGILHFHFLIGLSYWMAIHCALLFIHFLSSLGPNATANVFIGTSSPTIIVFLRAIFVSPSAELSTALDQSYGTLLEEGIHETIYEVETQFLLQAFCFLLFDGLNLPH